MARDRIGRILEEMIIIRKLLETKMARQNRRHNRKDYALLAHKIWLLLRDAPAQTMPSLRVQSHMIEHHGCNINDIPRIRDALNEIVGCEVRKLGPRWVWRLKKKAPRANAVPLSEL